MPKILTILPPEVQALIPNGIDKFAPRCVVCTNTVPEKRARGRSKDTCSPPCHAVLRLYRKFVIRTSKCLACYQPSTPEERAEFKRWRQARGDLRLKPGNPKRAKPVTTEANTETEIRVDSGATDSLACGVS